MKGPQRPQNKQQKTGDSLSNCPMHPGLTSFPTNAVSLFDRGRICFLSFWFVPVKMRWKMEVACRRSGYKVKMEPLQTHGCGSNIGTPHGTLASGNMDRILWSNSWWFNFAPYPHLSVSKGTPQNGNLFGVHFEAPSKRTVQRVLRNSRSRAKLALLLKSPRKNKHQNI